MRILIVGAGPTGAALSFLLARHGIDIVLLERETDFDRVFRGEALMPSGVEAIEQMGLRAQFDQLPKRVVECMEFYVDGDRVVRADWPEISGPNAAHIVSQPALLEMLTRAAGAHPGFELWMGTLVRDVAVTGDGAKLLVQRGGVEQELRGDFVVGADGRSSMVRARAGLSLERLPFPFDVAWFSLPLPSDQSADPRFVAYSRDGRSVGLYPSWDERLRVGLNVPMGTAGRHATLLGGADLVEDAAPTVGEPYATFFREHADEVADPVVFKILFGRCSCWSAPRLLLLGDAAHPMSPIRAQGINLALRDAIVAANHLVPAIRSGRVEALEQAADRIQAEREPEIAQSQRYQVALAEPPPPARSAFLRATLLPVLRRIGIVKRLFLKAEIPLRHGVVPVKLEV